MRSGLKLLLAGVTALLVTTVVAWLSLAGHGFTARGDPSALETFIARRARHLAVPKTIANTVNPVPDSPQVLREAMAHFADHCAFCHANDGSGNTGIGRNLYPPAPDMRGKPTQSLSDGELFYLIHNGIPLTGMPAWGDGDFGSDEGSWQLVHFIRHLPDITESELAEMSKMNPKSAHELAEEEAIRNFLSGDDDAAPNSHGAH